MRLTARNRLRVGLTALLSVTTVGALAMPAHAATTTASIKWSQPYVADDMFHGGGIDWSDMFCHPSDGINYTCPTVNVASSGNTANFHIAGKGLSAQEAGFALRATSDKFTVPSNYKPGSRVYFTIPVQMSGSWTCSAFGGVSQASVASNVGLYNDKNQLVAEDTYSVQQDCGARTKIGGEVGVSKDGPGASVKTEDLLPTSSGSFNSKLTAGIDTASPNAYVYKNASLKAGKTAYVKINYFIWGLAGGPVSGDMNMKKITWTSKPSTGSLRVY